LCFIERAKQKVSPGYSPADDSAGSLTPVEMTLRNGLAKREKIQTVPLPSLPDAHAAGMPMPNLASAAGGSDL